jgi:hypothetical protein
MKDVVWIFVASGIARLVMLGVEELLTLWGGSYTAPSLIEILTLCIVLYIWYDREQEEGTDDE